MELGYEGRALHVADREGLQAVEEEGLGNRGRELAARRRGVVPSDLQARISLATSDFLLRNIASLLARFELQGLQPAALTPDELARLRETYGEPAGGAELVDEALKVLVAVGYGKPRGRKPRQQRAHGVRREQRLRGVTGKTARAFALRAPFTADTHRAGRMDGVDVWGPVKCSHTLRSLHHALVAAAGGLWHKRSKDGQPFFDCTATELAALHNGRTRQGGKEIAEVMGALADLAALKITATVDHRGEGEPSAAHVIPGSPIAKVERRVPGTDRWVELAEYAEALDTSDVAAARSAIEADEDSSAGTLRVHLAPWVIEEITGRHGRGPVLVNFDVWAHLRPTARRVYVFAQGRNRSLRDRSKCDIYLAEELRFTLGLQGERHEAAAAFRHAMTALYHADQRYHSGFGAYTHPNGHPAFEWRPDGPSRPTHKCLVTKVPPRRPGVLRGLQSRIRHSALLAGRTVRVDELDPGYRREVGDEQALREAQEVRRQVLESLGASYGSRQFGDDAEQRERAARRASAQTRAARAGPEP